MISLPIYDGKYTLTRDDKHVYRVDGAYKFGVTGVTDTLSIGGKTQSLMGWAVDSALRQLTSDWPLVDGNGLGHVDEKKRGEMFARAKEAHVKHKQSAATIGSDAHDWVEQHIKSLIEFAPEPTGPGSPEALSAVDAFLKWESKNNVQYLYSERPVYSESGDFCGTLDIVAMVNDKLTIVDLKGFPLDTRIPTPSGWKTMGDVSVGDQLYDANGKVCRVKEKSARKFVPGCRITFDDGTNIVCDNEHLWSVIVATKGNSNKKKRYERVLSTASMIEEKRMIYVPVSPPITGEQANLPIDPYVLGVWLGDGCKKENKITSCDRFVFQEINRRGYGVSDPHGSDISKAPTRTIYGLREELSGIGVLGTRVVPPIYLRASIGQRLDLLRGLMDSDGSANPCRKEAIFYNTEEQLAVLVHELAASLGCKPYMYKYVAKGFGKTVDSWAVRWRVFGVNPFLLPRKADKVLATEGWVPSRRMVVSVEPLGFDIETQCIQVDSDTECYLVTDKFICTHNTSNSIRDEYRLQTAAYAHAFMEEFPERRFADRWCLRLDKESGEFDEREGHWGVETMDAEYRAFLGALAVRRWSATLPKREYGKGGRKRASA